MGDKLRVETRSELRPVEIAGGGLAGLALGLGLRRAGVPVTLHEAGSYPRHRVCGEFIAGLAPETIDRLGLEPCLRDARRHGEVAWYFGGRLGCRQRLPGVALGLSRYALDARLAEAFQAAGGDLRVHSRVELDGAAPGRVVATGRVRGRSPWLGLKFHALNLPLAAGLEVHLGRDAYVGLAGIEGGRVNVCGYFRRRGLRATGPALVRAYLLASGLGGLAARLAAAGADPASFAAVAGLVVDGRMARRPDLRLGDACAMIAPFTGDGMAMAFQGAEAALGPLVAYAQGAAWPEVAGAIRSALARQFRCRLASANALHGFMLGPRRQRWLAAAARTGLLPLRPLYSLLH